MCEYIQNNNNTNIRIQYLLYLPQYLIKYLPRIQIFMNANKTL